MPKYDRKDKFYQKAKKEGFVARSAYKLEELDRRFRILKAGHRIVDLGCAPGSWLQVAEKKLGAAGKIAGIDLLPLHTSTAPTVTFIQGNFLELENQQKMMEALGGKAHWVLSDMSPNLTGIKFKDLAQSQELCVAAFEFTKNNLAKGGGMVMKIFPGPEIADFKKSLKACFEKISEYIPAATRNTSNEVY